MAAASPAFALDQSRAEDRKGDQVAASDHRRRGDADGSADVLRGLGAPQQQHLDAALDQPGDSARGVAQQRQAGHDEDGKRDGQDDEIEVADRDHRLRAPYGVRGHC